MDRISSDKLVEGIRAVTNEAQAFLNATATQTGDQLDEARSRLGKSLVASRKKLQSAGSLADRQVHEHAWAVAGIAVGLGLALGILLSRRN